MGAGLWLLAAGAGALSLGASRGAVVLGAPVDLSFDVQPDPGSDVGSSCVSAQLLAGDTPIHDSKVRIVPWPDMRGRSPAVRLQAVVAVDEPVLTVILSAGCVGKVTRTYTFLVDLPTTVVRSGAPVDVARLSSLPGSSADAPRNLQRAPVSRAAPTTPIAPPEKRPVAAEPAPAPAAGTRPAPRSAAQPPSARSKARLPAKAALPQAPAAAPQATGRSRLVVDPLDDLWLDRPVALRTSPEMLLTPSDEPSAQRAQAAALWKALNAQPEDGDPNGDRLKSLEADIATLRAQAERDRASALQVQQHLELALEERFPATLVYMLGGLLLAALLMLAWLSRKLRTVSEKNLLAWRDSVVAVGGLDAMAEHEEALGLTPHPGDTWTPSEMPPPPAPGPRVSAPQPLAAGSGAVPLAPTFVATVPAPSAAMPLQAPAATLKGSSPPPVPLHIVGPEELFDIQQQAEFFVSVGEHQQAIDVLTRHIAERGDVSPLAYLELLRLYHTLSRVEEFTALRQEFLQSFNAQVPEFAVFHRTGRMLYHYTDALAEIEAQWTSPTVLALLERFLFRREGGDTVERFDLAAYDELLLLLAIAQTTLPSGRGNPAPRKRTTPLAPERADAVVIHKERPARAAEKSDPPLVDPSEAQTQGDSLDLDLNDPPHVTLSDLPSVPVTPPPSPGQAVGFGMVNELMELRLELEEQAQNKGRRS